MLGHTHNITIVQNNIINVKHQYNVQHNVITLHNNKRRQKKHYNITKQHYDVTKQHNKTQNSIEIYKTT